MFKITNKSFQTAYKKGKIASAFGRPESSNPYPDKKNNKGGVTFSRAFRNYWLKGYNDTKVKLGLFV